MSMKSDKVKGTSLVDLLTDAKNIEALEHIHLIALDEPVKGFFEAFFARYLCGGEALKGCRGVSRKRLAMAYSGVNCFDAQSLYLSKQIDNYIAAKSWLLKNRISIESLNDINYLMRKSDSDGKQIGIRTSEVFVGKSYEKATYIPPNYTLLEELMSDLISFLNCDKVSSITKSYVAMSQLAQIHPYTDGNGRVSRLLWESIIDKESVKPIHPSLYRLSISKTPQLYKSKGFKDHETVNYWVNSALWGEKLKEQINVETKKTVSAIQTKLLFKAMMKESMLVVNRLWLYPVFTINSLVFKGVEILKFEIIEELKVAGIIKNKRTNILETGSVFEAEILTAYRDKIESLIFSTEAGN
ncbi:Fic family protein [Pseudoalteromonas sp. MMG022]|uniref:Fic family protein n=1 Tax=Pseudoalteromonas sp. MMG022 TaxID=2909978 RepID=UPI001F478662|nr:Fic family protein [Pseudoalteromonas sp. MMG022]MCF6436005.1 Fic family protein [Pseudoalteromonas sp. MMG022]